MAEILPNPRRSAPIGGILKPVVQMIRLLPATRCHFSHSRPRWRRPKPAIAPTADRRRPLSRRNRAPAHSRSPHGANSGRGNPRRTRERPKVGPSFSAFLLSAERRSLRHAACIPARMGGRGKLNRCPARASRRSPPHGGCYSAFGTGGQSPWRSLLSTNAAPQPRARAAECDR